MAYLTKTDKYIYDHDIAPYLPKKLFDVHSHIYINKFMPELHRISTKGITITGIIDWWKKLFSNCEVIGNIMGFPKAGADEKIRIVLEGLR